MAKENICLLEKVIQQSGFKLIHDGTKNPIQVQLNPEDVTCFTRKYRLQIDGIWHNTWIVFKYDSRKNFMGIQTSDFEVYSREPGYRGREQAQVVRKIVDA